MNETDQNLDKMSNLLGGLAKISGNMRDEMKVQEGLTADMDNAVDSAHGEVESLNDRTGKLLGKGKKK